MAIKVASFNVNNLFERAKVMQLEGFSKEASKVLSDVSKLNGLLEREDYGGKTGEGIIELLKKYFLPKDNPWFQINVVKGKLYGKTKDKKDIKLIAKGHADWLGWVDLYREGISEECISNTARVVQAINPDIMCVVEVEDRLTLDRFNTDVLKTFDTAFAHNMLIDGNDSRGIDVGLLSQHEIVSMKSHIDDTYKDKKGQPRKVFSRDCPEYRIRLSSGKFITMLCNHLKSQGYGTKQDNDAKRKLQAERVNEILKDYDLTKDLVAVAGDFNDQPSSDALKPLLQTPNLHDVLKSTRFNGPDWTYQEGNQRLDYLLVSKPLFDKLAEAGIERRGIYKRGNPCFPEVTSKVNQASDHAAVWAVFDI